MNQCDTNPGHEPGRCLHLLPGRLPAARFRENCLKLNEWIAALAGKGKTRDVIARVGVLMKGVLKPKDHEQTASRRAADAKELRWENTTRWARQRMVEDGRLKSSSPNGVWEISDAGRQWLKAHGP